MTLYLDIHRNQGDVSREALARTHMTDLEAQERYGVRYLKYWHNATAGTIFCLVEGPSEEACAAVHRSRIAT